MYQEVEGQRPVIVSRNHNARVRPPVYRWTEPPGWDTHWNFQSSLISGLSLGLGSAFYLQLYAPASDLLQHYQAPDNMAQLRIFLREVVKMENFRSGLLSNAAFYSTYGLTFHTSRLWLWKTYAGGFARNPSTVDYAWSKVMLLAMAVGASTSWIPVPFHNVAIRYEQDKILPKELSRGYRNHLHAALSILKNDGPYPLMRSATPLMAEFGSQTFGILFWMDFLKDKFRAARTFGLDFSGFPDSYTRIICTTAATYLGLMHGYPFKSLRNWVESLPKNSRGELAFNNYAECFWKALGDTYNVAHLWNGFHRYLIRAGPPLWISIWIADSLGVFNQPELPAVYLPSE